jgi:hypothetical protein
VFVLQPSESDIADANRLFVFFVFNTTVLTVSSAHTQERSQHYTLLTFVIEDWLIIVLLTCNVDLPSVQRWHPISPLSTPISLSLITIHIPRTSHVCTGHNSLFEDFTCAVSTHRLSYSSVIATIHGTSCWQPAQSTSGDSVVDASHSNIISFQLLRVHCWL